MIGRHDSSKKMHRGTRGERCRRTKPDSQVVRERKERASAREFADLLRQRDDAAAELAISEATRLANARLEGRVAT